LEKEYLVTHGMNYPQSNFSIGKAISQITLLIGIFIATNIIYQRSYLAFHGIEKGIFSLDGQIFLFHNYLIAAYSFFLWSILLLIPQSFFDHISRSFSLSDWTDYQQRFLQKAIIFVILMFFYLFFLAFYAEINRLLVNFVGIIEPYFGQSEIVNYIRMNKEVIGWSSLFFSFLLLSASSLSFMFYRKSRDSGICQAFRKRRKSLYFFLNVVIPFGLILIIYPLIYVVPKELGTFFAWKDMKDFELNHTQLIRNLRVNQPMCGLSFKYKIPGENIQMMPSHIEDQGYYEWSSGNEPIKVYYIGSFQNKYEIVKLRKDNEVSLEYQNDMECLISKDEIIALGF
jgi:hypothetical protein